MSEASRLRPPSWRDPRLSVGVLLVALSVALGWWAVSSASQRVGVYSAVETLTPGSAVDGRLAVVEVDPGIAHLYVGADSVPEGVVDRLIEQGELIPASALTTQVDQRTVVIPSATLIPDGVGPGSRIDVWFTPSAVRDDSGEPPQLVAEDLVVETVISESSFLASQYGGVQVLVPPEGLPDILAAMAAEGSLVIVPRGS